MDRQKYDVLPQSPGRHVRPPPRRLLNPLCRHSGCATAAAEAVSHASRRMIAELR